MAWQRYNKDLRKSLLLAEYFSFWTNLTLFCPLWNQGHGQGQEMLKQAYHCSRSIAAFYVLLLNVHKGGDNLSLPFGKHFIDFFLAIQNIFCTFAGNLNTYEI